MLDELIKATKKRIRTLSYVRRTIEQFGYNASKDLYKILQEAENELKCLEYLKLFITNAQVIKTDKEQIVSVVSTIKDQKVLVDLIRFIIKEAV